MSTRLFIIFTRHIGINLNKTRYAIYTFKRMVHIEDRHFGSHEASNTMTQALYTPKSVA
jgi:hypothetical protein